MKCYVDVNNFLDASE